MVQLFPLKSKPKTGIELTRAGKTEEAIAYYTSLLACAPKDLEIKIELARLYFKKEDYPSTKQILLEVLKYNLTLLEITNFKRIGSDSYFNAEPSFSADGKKLFILPHDGMLIKMDKLTTQITQGRYS